MFDELHDPDPPRPGLDALAAVSERARRLRRRRTAAVATVSVAVVALLVVGIAVITGGDGEDRIVGVPAATADDVPAVTTGSTAPATVPSTTPATEAPTTAPATSAAPTTTPTTTAVGVAPEVLPSERAIVAVNGDGDAVYVPAAGGEPVLLHDGTDPDDAAPSEGESVSVDGVAVLPDESVAFVGVCCEPVAGSLLRTVPPAVATYDSPSSFGTAPALDPTGTRVAAVSYFTIQVLDGAGQQLATSEELDTSSTPWEVAWIDETRLAVLGAGPDGYQLHVFRVVGDQIVEERRGVVAGFDPAGRSPSLAGISAEGAILLAGIEPSALIGFDPATLAPGAPLALPAEVLRAWFDGETLLWVGTDRVLHVGDATLPGEYIWVRR